MRVEAGLRQEEVARELGRPQSFVSNYELGERRLDVLELWEICSVCGVALEVFVSRLEQAIQASRSGVHRGTSA